MAVDGWEDARHLTVLGITALPPGKQPLLVAFDRVEDRDRAVPAEGFPCPEMSRQRRSCCRNFHICRGSDQMCPAVEPVYANTRVRAGEYLAQEKVLPEVTAGS